MAAPIFISYRNDDLAYAKRLHESLRQHFLGDVLLGAAESGGGQGSGSAIDDALASCEAIIIVIGPGWAACVASSARIVAQLAHALSRGVRVLPVLVGGAVMPRALDLPPALAALAAIKPVALRDQSWKRDVTRIGETLALPVSPAAPAGPSRGPKVGGAKPSLSRGVLNRIRGWLGVRGEGSPPSADVESTPLASAPRVSDERVEPAPVAYESAPPPPPTAGAEPPASPAPAEEPRPVLLGVSAPAAARPGATFTARFAAYVEAVEQRVRQQLEELSGGEAQTVLGLTPDSHARWRVGTPVRVAVTGTHLVAKPAQRSFEWNGQQNILAFLVTVAADAPAQRTQLCFEVFIADISIALIPMDFRIGDDAGLAPPATLALRPPTSAFASYASKDAALVTLCLSALERWDAGLKVFIDCLDLTPNAAWQRELEQVIAQKDAFLLFWSANAMNSPWVRWELQTAIGKKGIDAIRPFPLDDPAIAPPPDDLKQLHFRDRYLMARQGLLRIAEQKADAGGAATP